jgi:hypothetical protein
MPAMPTKVKIRARLCPQRSLADKSADPTWPRPQGLEIELKLQHSKAAVLALNPTDSDGETSDDLAAGTYTPTLAARQDAWKGWECSAQDLVVKDGEAEKTFDLRLVPPEDRRLLAVRLVRREDPDDDPEGLGSGTIKVTKGNDFDEEFGPSSDAGDIYAWAPSGNVCVRFSHWTAPDKKVFDPVYPEVTFSVPGQSHKKVSVAELGYRPADKYVTPPEEPPFEGAKISIAPKVMMPSGSLVPFTGATVAVDLHPDSAEPVSLEGTLGTEEKHVSFENQVSGVFSGMVIPPGTFNGWLVKESPKPIGNHFLPAGESVTAAVPFTLDATRIEGHVLSPLGTPLEHDLRLEIFCPGMRPLLATASKGTYTADVPTGAPLKIRLAPRAEPRLDGLPLQMDPADQEVLPSPQVTTVTLAYKHYIKGQAVDESGNPMPYAVVDVFDGPDKIASVVGDQDGLFLAGLEHGGSFIVAVLTEGGEPVTGKPVTISSGFDLGTIGPRARRTLAAGPLQSGSDGGGSGSSQVREAFTDLAAYPVLTEEVSTTGIPGAAPAGLGTAGADYGQVIDRAMRDVLGWRPSGDVAGFQAALAGAFQLREVEGHTAWAWQQRGYAVQADMGALTGAQASIYARAKSALDQIQPLLAGLTTLNPALYEPQDLETIRTVVATELQELVSELALEGGPRIQRVDELFRLLLGEGRGSRSMDPDRAQGNLGILRERFALTVDEIQTVDEERIVTNFRIIVEQVLALFRSWQFDRGLLSGVDTRTALGTILIWLSRGLEAVCESVGDLMFALDSVFVDAAQRQVIELRFAGLAVKDVPEVPLQGNPPQTITQTYRTDEPPMFLSDLLDWVLRACRDEGPKIVQDAGKQGVLAFKPVLNTLRILVRATGQIAHERGTRGTIPAGMRTPRVERAIKVLAAQLDEAANLASLVRAEDAPQIAYASLLDPSSRHPVNLASLKQAPAIEVVLTGSNFRAPARAQLTAEDNEDLPGLGAVATVNTPSTASAIFANPGTRAENAGTTWQVQLINADGTQSNQIEVLRVPR